MKTLDEYVKLYREANEYATNRYLHARIRNDLLRRVRLCNIYPCYIFDFVNIPNVGRCICEHKFDSSKAPSHIATYLVDDGNLVIVRYAGYAGMDDGSIVELNEPVCIIIHRHAFERYIERHRYSGDVDSAMVRYLTIGRRESRKEDHVTHELIGSYDGGVFLGDAKDGINHFRTFVMLRQLYQNQRFEKLEVDEFTKKYKEFKAMGLL